MIELGYAKAKSKATNQWVEGYFFKYEKFNGKENEYILFKTGENKPGESFMENPVNSTIIWKETLSFFSGFETEEGKKLYQGDMLKDDAIFGVVSFNETDRVFTFEFLDEQTKEHIQVYGLDFHLSDFMGYHPEAQIIGNIHDDFNLSKKELKEKRRKKNLLPSQ